ncbi:MAG: SAM-dependent methyltransferase [Microbacterium sp.]|jgi:SAM-dependent methyltransferase|uniref:class I SAM-dependent methyltransferase n=1 Tax=Microbacterium sp. TaxID=51671 RepID=UPI002605571C|nr:class I SAM-dependent methyltransferase [Microbacterium sp.]MDF2563462.1 SAM-dependent methyltransferase [Microbacterium sp.]
MSLDIQAAYSNRAAEYVQALGSTASAHPADVQLITSWAAHVNGLIVDAGCGPGHWSAYLTEAGHPVRGVDQVPEFISHARHAYPGVTFELGSINQLPLEEGSVGGILAWYSLIHHDPRTVRATLEEFARVLKPGGALLTGFFIGTAVEPFDHTVVTAYRWPPEALANELCSAGFDVVETHTRTGREPKPRPHGAILAELAPA